MTAKYEKPALQRFGTFRELTLVGWKFASDGGTVLGAPSAGGNCTSFDEVSESFVGCIS
jgi:hypothetical protein